jgi:hypothetical protein
VPRDVLPSAGLACRLQRAAGNDDRYRGLSDGGVVLAAGRWDAIASWAMARELAAARELIRRMPLSGHEPEDAGELPEAWAADLADQLALELSMARGTAAVLVKLAWDLEVRLPLTGQALSAGILSYSKARMIANETAALTPDLARQAEAQVAPHWDGLTWSMLQREIALAVIRVDPDGARARRESAEREQGRVRFWRDAINGTAHLSGADLPTDQALAAWQHVKARADAYKKWGLNWPAELLRVQAYLDILNQTDYRHTHDTPEPAPGSDGTSPWLLDDNPRTSGDDEPDGAGYEPGDSNDEPGDTDDGPGDTDGGPGDTDGGPGDSNEGPGDSNEGPGDADGGPGGGDGKGGPGGGNGGDGGCGCGGQDVGLAANMDLTLPMSTLLGLREHPGLAGDLAADPALVRQLAARAARHPGTDIQVILTDDDGHAVGFGHAVRTRDGQARAGPGPPGPDPPGQDPLPGTGTPAQEGGHGPPGAVTTFSRTGEGPSGGYGTWALDIDGNRFAVRLAPIQTGTPCDHRYESTGYHPSDTLRRLVRIRDGTCVFPTCGWKARHTDWDHVLHWPAGRTCSCNGENRCRHDHILKQDSDWRVELRPDGRHQWTTPTGLTYSKQPHRYPI